MEREVFPGRYTARPEGESVTVFLIGMRANKWWQTRRVSRVAKEMPRMLRHLSRHPESGMLGFESWVGRTTILLSYWESPEHLQRFAADPDAPHLKAWRDYARRAGDGAVGVWHETYQVPVRDMEAVYVDMPDFGLAAATGHHPVGAGERTARQRLGRDRTSSQRGGAGSACTAATAAQQRP
ncbi:DUF4188 domain-containing protein [Microbacterium sp. KR10-403]|uniref:DUF4188 domain-containing protein n=1 Tax=Microbacterium sp. KR10-403 TaxID=3158581 RepID=UPI0032E3F2ED